MTAAAEPAPPSPTAHEAALSYAAHGLRVLPIKPGEKYPPMTEWQNAATTDTATITSWFTQLYRNHGVGLAMGPGSGIWCLDVDVSDGKDGEASYEALISEIGDLPPTVTAVTGSGGFHYLFKWPTDGTDIRNDQSGKLGAGLDIRGDGGQIVAAPTIHKDTKVAYRWVTGAGPDDIEVADTPPALLEKLRQVTERAAPPKAKPTATAGGDDIDSPAEWFNDHTTWPQLLERDRFTHSKTFSNGEQRWTRPDKRGGTSVTVMHAGRDVLKCFTSSMAELSEGGPPGTTATAYNRFYYEAAMHWHDDRSALARHVRLNLMPRQEREAGGLEWQIPIIDLEPGSVVDDDDPHAFAHIVKWNEFWDKEHTGEQWLIYPLIPIGRAISLYAPAKAGKSSVLLASIAAAVAGRPLFGGQPADDRPSVLYLDYEMTEADLEERLTELGFGPEDDLDGLHYALLPSIEPLDTSAGAKSVVNLAVSLGVDAVIVDTFGRAVEGEENSADTVRAFYRYTGLALKAHGIAVLRTDHTGKDAAKGQRGTSAKNDDVDVVWSLTRTDLGARLKRTHTRVTWVPETVELLRRDNDHDGIVTWSMASGAGYLAGTKEKSDILDGLGVPASATKRATRAALKEAGIRCGNELLNDVIRWRKNQAQNMVLEVPESGPPAKRPTISEGVRPTETAQTAHLQNSRSEGVAHATAQDGPLPATERPKGPLVERPMGRGSESTPSTPVPPPVPDPDDDEDLDRVWFDDDDNPINPEETP